MQFTTTWIVLGFIYLIAMILVESQLLQSNPELALKITAKKKETKFSIAPYVIVVVAWPIFLYLSWRASRKGRTLLEHWYITAEEEEERKRLEAIPKPIWVEVSQDPVSLHLLYHAYGREKALTHVMLCNQNSGSQYLWRSPYRSYNGMQMVEFFAENLAQPEIVETDFSMAKKVCEEDNDWIHQCAPGQGEV